MVEGSHTTTFRVGSNSRVTVFRVRRTEVKPGLLGIHLRVGRLGKQPLPMSQHIRT